MGSHPLNLGVRFLLEVSALVAIGYWGWSLHDGLLRLPMTLGFPTLAAALWATLTVPRDPSRSGKAPAAIPGFARLLLEWGLFVAVIWGLAHAGAPVPAWILAAVTSLHYALSYDRLRWLLTQ